MTKSPITGIEYEEVECAFITNPYQALLYLKNGASCDLCDVLWSSERRPDCLVFVFKKTELIKRLYAEWNTHKLK